VLIALQESGSFSSSLGVSPLLSSLEPQLTWDTIFLLPAAARGGLPVLRFGKSFTPLFLSF